MKKMAKCGPLLLALLGFLISSSEGQNQPEKQTLQVASLLSAPFLQLKQNDSLTGNKDDYEGFIKDLLDALGYDYQIVLPEDRKYGQPDPTDGSTWNGMVGLANEKRVHMIAADLTVSSKRQEVLDFSVPFMSSRLTILTKLGHDDGSQWPVIVSPFDISVWILLVAAFLVSAFVFFLVKRISPYERVWSVNKARNVPDITLNDSFWILIACFFHGTKSPAKAPSSRLLVAGWWLFVVAVVAAYAANLNSIWSLVEGSCVQKSKYERIEDMLENPEFKFFLFKHGTTHQLLKSSTDSLHRRIYERVNENAEESFINSQMEGVDRLSDVDVTNVGLVLEGSTADFIKTRHCGFYTVGQLDERHYALAFPKGSSLTNTISQSLLNLVESGTLQEIKNRWWTPSNSESCLDKTAGACEGLGPLQISHFDGPLLFLAVVLVLALVLSVLELICHACDKKEPGVTAGAIIARDLKEGCCGCIPVSGSARTAKTEDPENK